MLSQNFVSKSYLYQKLSRKTFGGGSARAPLHQEGLIRNVAWYRPFHVLVTVSLYYIYVTLFAFYTIAAGLDHATLWILQLCGQESLLVPIICLEQTFHTAKFNLKINFFWACSVLDISKICKFFFTSSWTRTVFTILQNSISSRQREFCLTL